VRRAVVFIPVVIAGAVQIMFAAGTMLRLLVS
jgi:hypothetical protein